MDLIAATIRHPVSVSVGVLLLTLFGALSIQRMPMQLIPEVEQPTLSISTRWPGASPQEVERELVDKQEEQLKGVEGVVKMSSESQDSQGVITLEFAVGTDMRAALLKVNARLSQVGSYPADAKQPVIATNNAANRPIAWFVLGPRMPDAAQVQAARGAHPGLASALDPVLRARGDGLALLRLRRVVAAHPELAGLLPPEIDVTKLQRYAEDQIEARFERVSGVANSNVIGGQEDEVQVIVDPQALAARGLSIADVRRAMGQASRDTAGGDLWEGKRRYVVRTLGQFRSLDDVRALVLARRDGGTAYLGDVAEVRIGFKKPTGLVRRFGSTALAINCERQSGANVLEVMRGLKAVAAELNAGVLAARGLTLTQVYDETEYIDSSIGLVTENIVSASVLTILVLLMFLKSARSTFVVALSIPISLIGTFLVLDALGRSLNVISLAGLAFAVGMLVDNAVVVLENIFTKVEAGATPFEAARSGASEVWGAVVASTLTTLAVFLPVLSIKEEAGKLFGDIALAISAAVGLSLVVSILVIPTAAARILTARRPGRRGLAARMAGGLGSGIGRLWGGAMAPFDWAGGAFSRGVVGANAWLLGGWVRRAALVLAMVAASLAGSWALLPKVEYLPTGNQNLVFGILLPPPGYNLEEMVEIGQKLEAAIEPYWNVDPGTPEAAALDAPPIGDFFFVARGRNLFLGLRAADPLKAAGMIPLVRKAGAVVPGTFAIAKQASLFEQGLSAGRTIDIEITGPELETLIGIGMRVMGDVRRVFPEAQALPRPSLDLSSPELHVRPRWEQAADLGVSAADLGYAVDALLDGAYAGDFYQGGDKLDLVILGKARFAGRTQDLEAMPIATPAGGPPVALGAVATVELSSGPEQINRRERARAITIQVSPPATVALEDAMERISKEIIGPLVAGGVLEGGRYRVALAGTADKLRTTWEALRWNLLLALLVTYLLLAALFESWVYPGVIIASVPLGAVGGIGALWLLNLYVFQPLDVLTMLGFVILIGTVVNNPILIVHQALVRMGEGWNRREAILDATRTRIRPIFITTTTTVLGLLPLVLFPGAGSELYRGLGGVVLGGLVVSTLFTLLLVPALFSLVLDLGAWLGRMFAEPRDAGGVEDDPERDAGYEDAERVGAEESEEALPVG